MRRSQLVTLLSAAALTLTVGLAGCAGGGGTTESGAGAPSAAAPGEVAGFEEFPIGDDVEVGPLNIAGVYFQPVDMEPAGLGLPASESDVHMEADISALTNDLGYGVGDFVPNLTVDYEITAPDGTVSKGTFMPMNASDGPHYGANLKLGAAGTYGVKFLVKSPAEQDYLLHTDQATGVPGHFWTEPLVAEWQFNYVPRTW